MDCRLSVIIPNRNGENTIGLCLEALFKSKHDSFEVIVVDDCSRDNSISIIERFPCKLIKLEQHAGASKARNIGALNSRGNVLFFTDADCLVNPDTLDHAEKLASVHGHKTIIGGTYTCHPHDQFFYSYFQSIFIHYCELKNIRQPDYIAAHAMVITASAFRESGGFPEEFLPIIEDVEFSHRLRRKGFALVMSPAIQVRHIFGYRNLTDSIKNGYRKSKYWTMYSLGNKDLLKDSGTSSFELKVNVLSLFASLCLTTAFLMSSKVIFLILLSMIFAVNVWANLRLFALFYRTGAKLFLMAASLYYLLVYPFAVGAGALAGMFNFVFNRRTVRA